MKFEIPHPLKIEHEELHGILRKATKEPGEIGDSAKAVAEVMHPHFVKEEEYALPLLGMLHDLAQGKVIWFSVISDTGELRNISTPRA